MGDGKTATILYGKQQNVGDRFWALSFHSRNGMMATEKGQKAIIILFETINASMGSLEKNGEEKSIYEKKPVQLQ